MKSIFKATPFLLFVICFSLTSCGGEEATTELREEKVLTKADLDALYDTLADEAKKSETKKDTIVLDFYFGMSRNDVYRHTKRLASKKKMYPIQKTKTRREYVYDLQLDGIGRLRTHFDSFYDKKKKLYKTEALPKIPKDYEPHQIADATIELYSKKYGKPHILYTEEMTASQCVHAIWIEANRQIGIQCSDKKVAIYYTDLSNNEHGGSLDDI